MPKDDSAYRSLTEKPGWKKKACERCFLDFWLTPAQFKNGIRYCTSTCRYETPEQVIEKTTTKGVGPYGECWECSLTPSADYPQIKIKGAIIRVSHLVLEKKLGRPMLEGMKALHAEDCNNPRCIRESHISEGTQRENAQQAARQGRMARGENHTNAELTEIQVKEIMALKGTGLLLREVAERFSVGTTTICDLWNGKRWKHVDAVAQAGVIRSPSATD